MHLFLARKRKQTKEKKKTASFHFLFDSFVMEGFPQVHFLHCIFSFPVNNPLPFLFSLLSSIDDLKTERSGFRVVSLISVFFSR